MNIVIPMAGNGSRFREAGYAEPKYLIRVKGKSLLSYSLESLPIDIATQIIFVALEDHIHRYQIEELLHNCLNGKKFTLIAIPRVTSGQAETVLKAKPLIDNETDLIIYNIDTFFHSGTLTEKLLDRQKKHDGVIGSFTDRDPKWSFAKVNRHNFVTETAEKEVISDHALTGLYHFSSGHDFVRTAEYCLSNKITTSGEYYIAPMYNHLIREGKRFVLDPADIFIPLGTPKDVSDYEKR